MSFGELPAREIVQALYEAVRAFCLNAAPANDVTAAVVKVVCRQAGQRRVAAGPARLEGALVGGASLNADQFLAIVRAGL